MKIYIKDATVYDSKSPYHQKNINILIEDGLIKSINPDNVPDGVEEVSHEGLMVSPSWFDMRIFSGEPGEEYREDLDSMSRVLESGGFGAGLLMPNNVPVTQNKSAVKSILAHNTTHTAALLPAAAISKDAEGEEMNEMLDLHHAGAIAFTDGANPLWNSDLLVKTLQYLQKFDGLLINFPQDRKLAMFGQMNEGVISTGLGMKGIPNIAEEIVIQRDLELLRYAGGKIHFSSISTAKSVALIKEAKNEGLKVSCDVSIHHLILDDSNLESFDTNYKVLPPLRSTEDVNALIEGVNDGTIDVIVSSHQPYDEDHKKMEFDLASFGIMGAQIVYPLYHQFLKDKIDLDTFLQCISVAPRNVLGLEQSSVQEGEEAKLTVFTESYHWKFDANHNQSKSNNSPFMGSTFNALALGVINGKKHYLSNINKA